MMRPTRRALLGAAAGLIASPAIVRAGSIPLLGTGKPPSGGAFTPASLSPRLWLEVGKGGMSVSRSGGAAPTNGQSVGLLPDFSGNSLTMLSFADDTTRPVFTSGTFPYITFTAASAQVLSHQGASLGSWVAGSASCFACLRGVSPTANGFFLNEGGAVAGTGAFYSQLAIFSNNTDASAGIRDDAAVVLMDRTTANLNPGAYNNTDRVVGAVDNGTTMTPYLDSSTAGTPFTYTARGASVLTMDEIGLGDLVRAGAPNGTLTFDGRLYGLVVVNRVLTAPERSALVTYLGNLAGLSLS